MTKYISCSDTAKLVRKALKANFPAIKFSVRSDTYAGGASIRVSWVDGPAAPAVERVTRFFSGSTFDSSIDLKSYVETEWEGEKVHFGADYVFCNRNMSREFVTAVTSQFCKRFGIEMLEVVGSEQNAYVNTNRLDYSKTHWLQELLSNTDAKDMHRAYQAEDEREARERAEWEAQAKAQEEQEAKERAEAEQVEFAQWQQEQLNNEQWQREQFKKWQQEQERERERLAREEEERQEAQRQAEEKARRERQQREQEERARRQREQQERERIRSTYRSTLTSKEQSLAYLGLTSRATHADVMQAFRKKVKSAADGKGGYTIDMDFLVKVKERALR